MVLYTPHPPSQMSARKRAACFPPVFKSMAPPFFKMRFDIFKIF